MKSGSKSNKFSDLILRSDNFSCPFRILFWRLIYSFISNLYTVLASDVNFLFRGRDRYGAISGFAGAQSGKPPILAGIKFF
jgi:hypothetical protein